MFKTTFWQFFFNELSETKTDNLSQKDEAFGGGGGGVRVTESHIITSFYLLPEIYKSLRQPPGGTTVACVGSLTSLTCLLR